MIEKINLNSSDKLSIDFDGFIIEFDTDLSSLKVKSISLSSFGDKFTLSKSIETLGTSILVVDPVSIEKLYELINTN